MADAIERRGRVLALRYQSHMWGGSAVPLVENLRIVRELLGLSVKPDTIPQVEDFGDVHGVLASTETRRRTTPRSWGKPAETAMAARVVEATQMLGSAGRTMR
ncbi:MAG: hypothetical protein U5N21_15715 [Rhodococcus sp. (in: high G+C Gram-positive bacteria)]|uniref:hypothetical protein n=1 Tax=Rhodococcus sp. TaxID=1831 RepID=UPI002AD6B45B|nr:hypothetical protein [Rhodococcus sp. (in: high G+C Gram-positive bacteria)]MDZ7931413.1 hypothetical protein [Rhodococcus sp. (in: high G+C Gram-positive bacteria)]